MMLNLECICSNAMLTCSNMFGVDNDGNDERENIIETTQ